MALPAGQEHLVTAAGAFEPEKLAAIQQLSVDPVSIAAGGFAGMHESKLPASGHGAVVAACAVSPHLQHPHSQVALE